MKSILGKYPATPEQLFEMRRKVWLVQEILVVHKDQISDDWQRATIGGNIGWPKISPMFIERVQTQIGPR